jgi:putative ABC transport system permease protein
MNLAEALRTAIASLSAHKLRSALTMLGILFGVGAVLAMMSIGAGAERQAMRLIDAMGLRNVYVRAVTFPEQEREQVRRKSPGLSLRDARAIALAVPQVESVAPRVSLSPYKILSASGKSKAKVYGVEAGHAKVHSLALAEGRFFGVDEDAAHAQVCVIGSKVRRDLFGLEPAIGRDLKVNDVWLTVIGVLEAGNETDQEFLGTSIDSPANQILIPLGTARRKFEQEPLANELDEIRVTFSAEADPAASAQVIAALLDRLHGGAADTTLTVPRELLEQSRQTQRLFNIVMGTIAGISLLVGGIGIMNIMLATVLERTREIGVRRAVGARRSNIRDQFLIESFTISLMGGAAGVLAGVAIARVVAAYAGWTTVITPGAVVLSTSVSILVGLLFGIYPAVRAARLDPIDALRYE